MSRSNLQSVGKDRLENTFVDAAAATTTKGARNINKTQTLWWSRQSPGSTTMDQSMFNAIPTVQTYWFEPPFPRRFILTKRNSFCFCGQNNSEKRRIGCDSGSGNALGSLENRKHTTLGLMVTNGEASLWFGRINWRPPRASRPRIECELNSCCCAKIAPDNVRCSHSNWACWDTIPGRGGTFNLFQTTDAAGSRILQAALHNKTIQV